MSVAMTIAYMHPITTFLGLIKLYGLPINAYHDPFKIEILLDLFKSVLCF